MPKKLFLIDGSNHAFRVFYAMPRMTAGGVNTGALLGFANMLKSIERDHAPDYVVIAFDTGPSFRVQLYSDYKGHRPDMEEELKEQWPKFQQLIEGWGWRYMAEPDLEADDIIATLAQHASPELEVWVVSGDKDLQQLVNDHVRVLDLMKDRVIDREGVIERFGVPPERVIDVQALAGDSSDNVPGVPGIGVKTGAALINQYGSLDALLDAAATIKGKRGENLREFKDQALLSRQLVTLKIDCDLGVGLEDIAVQGRQAEPLRELFVRWQFRTHLRDLNDAVAGEIGASIDRSAYRTIRTRVDLEAAVAAIREAGVFSFDLETDSLDPLQARLVGACLCWSADDAVYVPLAHAGDFDQLGEARAMEALAPLLADPSVGKIGQNLKYDCRVLNQNGYVIEGIVGDTMLADYLLEPDRNTHGLDDLAMRYLGHKTLSFEETLGDAADFSQVPVEEATRYGAEDAHVAWLLHDQLLPRLGPLRSVYDEIDLPLVPLLARMEDVGVALDTDRLAVLAVEFEGRVAELEAKAHASAGREFNVNSPTQLGKILFEELGLSPKGKTKKSKKLSTNAATLEQLQGEHELPGLILEYRSLAKLKGTYIDALPGFVSPVTGRVHTSLHQAVAATGRLSSNNPNLQNIPNRTEEGRRIRECFIAPEGRLFLSCDYSQVELRLLAHYCETGPLVESFLQGEDIHTRTAAEIFEVEPGAVTREQRSAAKAINFGILYGMGSQRLARQIEVTEAQAQSYIDNYFARAPQVRGVIDQAVEYARTKGYAVTLWGRRRPVPDINSRNFGKRSFAERIAVNTPIQGSAADVMKMAMKKVDARLRADFPDVKMILQVHDELVFEVAEGEVEAVAASVCAEMEGVASLNVPLKVEAGWGRDWASAH